MNYDLLGLDEYYSFDFAETDETVAIALELRDTIAPECECDEPDIVKHGRRRINFLDFPVRRKATTLSIDRQRFRCRNCGRILLEELPGMDSDHRMTERFRKHLAEDAVKRTFTDAAEINGVTEPLVRRVFKEYAEKRLRHYSFNLPRVLGMDEKVISGIARFVVGDVESRKLLDMQPSRKQMDLTTYFDRFDRRHEVEVITQDMYWGYKTVNERYFRKALIVIDKFHVVRYANLAVEAVRKKVQNSLDNDGRVAMKRKIRLLAARPNNLGVDGKFALKKLFEEHPIIEKAVTFKEWFYEIYDCQSRAEAEKMYAAWLEMLPPEMEGPFTPLLKFMKTKRWRPLIFNYFEHPYTNAYVEAVNGLVDQINRTGRGYDFDTLRAKALLRYGNVVPLTDEVLFDLMSVPVEERAAILEATIGHGVDLSTFERSVAAETFW